MISSRPALAMGGAAVLAVLIGGSPATAREVRVPLALDAPFIVAQLRAQMFTEPDGSFLWQGGDGCNELRLSKPVVWSREGKLVVTSEVDARVGLPLGDWCVLPFHWLGEVDVLEEPALDPDAPIVRFSVLDSRVREREPSRFITAASVWDRIKLHVHPRFAAVTLDLEHALDELRGTLPLFLAGEDLARGQRLVDSLALEQAQVEATGVVLGLRFDVETRAAVASPPERELTPEEIAAFDEKLGRFDGFLTFVVKAAARDREDAEPRSQLLDVLLHARHDLVRALRAPHGPDDPVRPLFLRTWTRLAPLLRELHAGLPGEAALRYLTFVTAGDALRAVDELGPESGLEISQDGLRRLARVLGPEVPADPLAHGPEVDVELRELFGFGPALELPPPEPDAQRSQGPAQVVLVQHALPPQGEGPLIARLNRWEPGGDDLQDYLLAINELLHGVASTMTAPTRGLAPEHRPLFGNLLLATAWQESCWRQFVGTGAQRVPLRSPAGAVGLMQVNPHVWRGFYDVRALERDIGYNARAGAEILLHYLRDHAIAKGEQRVTGKLESLARAAYAAYNGGPRHLTRYRKEKTRSTLRRIDESFLAKYREVQRGDPLAVATCFGGVA